MEQVLHLRGADLRVRWRLVECRAPTLARWEGHGPARSQALIEYRLSAVAEGTRFDYHNEFQPPFGAVGALAIAHGDGARAAARGRPLAGGAARARRAQLSAAGDARRAHAVGRPPMRRVVAARRLHVLSSRGRHRVAAPRSPRAIRRSLHQIDAGQVTIAYVNEETHHVQANLKDGSQQLVAFPASQHKTLVDSMLHHGVTVDLHAQEAPREGRAQARAPRPALHRRRASSSCCC